MKITLFKYLTFMLIAFPLALFATDGKLKGKYSKEKTIKKEFDVNADALLKIKNSYGNLTLTSWDEDRVVIEVHVKTSGNNEEKVQQKLNNISVDFEASRSMVSAVTIFKKNNSWGYNWKGNNVNMQINYTIKLPVKNSVNLNNDYGSIKLDRIDGHAKISCDYGRLDIGELRGRNNQLNFDYTSKSNIEYINSGRITADYSGFTVEKAGDLTISADYTSSTVLEMKNLQYSCDYGNVDVKNVNNVQGSGDYISVKLGNVYGNVSIHADYGSIRIAELSEDAKNIEINTDYTSSKIGYNANYHFDFEIISEYAGIGGKENFEINISKEKSSSKYYKGYHGSPNSGNSVYINTEYGGVSFIKN